MHSEPNSVAGRAPFQGSTGSGSAQRKSPIGGSAYGIPLNTETVGCRSDFVPSISPDFGRTPA